MSTLENFESARIDMSKIYGGAIYLEYSSGKVKGNVTAEGED
ncbi:hypothetical protein ABW636_05135 [Aquimarina sp. 2201CG1-2-11]